MAVPAWQAPTSGQQADASAVNQLLGTHAITYLQSGTLKASSVTLGPAGVHSNGTWLAESFTTASGQTTIGYVLLYAEIAGTPGTPWTISVQASSAGAPSGTALVSAALPQEHLTTSYAWVMIPLPVTGLTASTTYWIVAQANGDPSNYFSWYKTTAASGASTSTNGTAWTAQSYGHTYQVFDQSAVAPLAGTWEDSGARWTSMSWASGELAGLKEYTAGQATTGYTAQARTLTYTSGLLTGVT